nr:MAG TPA: hypothetical protein [Caudoviricetes sp.]
MKIYVDEMPNNCKECGFCCRGDLCYWCQGIGDGGFYIPDETLKEKRLSGCPLLTTHSLKQQVREEVVEQVNDYMKKHSHTISVISKNRRVVYNIGLTRFLDQVKGESNEI